MPANYCVICLFGIGLTFEPYLRFIKLRRLQCIMYDADLEIKQTFLDV